MCGGGLSFGEEDVNLDHIHALSLFDCKNPDHVCVAWHYTNMQLLDRYVNRWVKRNRAPCNNFDVEKHVKKMNTAIDLIEIMGWTEIEVLDKMKKKEFPGYYEDKFWLR